MFTLEIYFESEKTISRYLFVERIVEFVTQKWSDVKGF